MCTSKQFSNLQKLAAFIRGNRNRILDILDDMRDQWEGKTTTVLMWKFETETVDAGLDHGTDVLCRVVTNPMDMALSRSRFCFHLRQGHCVVADTYVAGGFLFQEKVPPVVVGTKKQLSFY